MNSLFKRIAVGVLAFLVIRFVIVNGADAYHQRNLDRALNQAREAEQRTAEAFHRLGGR